ncbi:MAG: hypothetical protein E7318_08870 [Clostridiales bacterium]|nr:hypothetical protein [Clostridiales bacterium]
MQSKNKTLIPDEELIKRKRRKQVRNWIILIAVVLAIIGIVNLVGFLTRTSTVTALSLPCYAHQDVTVFQDGVLYYDGASIHFVNAGGGIEWSYPVGDGASFSVSEDHLVIWAGTQLFIVNEKGKPSFNESMEAPIQFARIGKKYAAVVTGDDLKSSLIITDLEGSRLDTEFEAFDGMLLLDCGFFGSNNEYIWTLAYDVYNPAIASILHTYQVGQMNTGEVNLGEHLAYKVIFADNLINVFTTQQMYIYDYKGVQNVNDTMLVYGWKYLDHALPERGATQFLLAPTAQTSAVQSITELRIFSSTLDRRYTLPSSCVGAAIDKGRIFAFSEKYLYAGNVSSQRFYAHDMRLPDGRLVTDFVGLTNNGYAVVISNNEVFSVSLPK